MITGNWISARFTNICPTADKPILIPASTCLARSWASRTRFDVLCHPRAKSRDPVASRSGGGHEILRLRFVSFRMRVGRLIMNPPDENILVIRRSLFDELGAFQGLSFEPEKYLRAILSRGNNLFIPRPQAESDPAFKQIIPYALIVFQ